MTNQELIEIKVLFQEAKEAFATMEKSVDSFTKKIDAGNKSLEEAEVKTKKNVSAFQTAGKALTDMGKGLDSLGNKLLYFGATWSAGVSVPLQRFGQDAVEQFLIVDKEWTRMSKAVGDNILSLKAKYSDLARTISERFGQAQSLVIQSFTDIAKAGFDSEKEITALGLAAAKAAVNFDTDLANATQLTIQMMSQWGWTIGQVETGLSMVNEVADATATSELGLAQAFTIAGPAAKAMGIEAENLAAMIAAVQRKGFTATKTGYALNTLFQRITTQTGDLSDALAIMGTKMSTNELKTKTATEKIEILAKAYKNFRDKTKLSSEVMQDFAKQAESTDGVIKTNNKNMANMADAISTLAGKQHFPKLLALLDDMANGMDVSKDTISDYTKALEVAGIGNEELNAIFETKTNKALESASAKWTQLLEKVNNAKIEIGGLILQAIVPLVDKFGALLDKFNALDDAQKTNIVKWGIIAAAIGPVTIIVASLVKGLALVTSTFGSLFSMIGGGIAAVGTGPFILIAAAIAGIIYWVVKFKDVFQKEFLDKLRPEVFEGIKKGWDSFVKGIQEGFGMINEGGVETSFLDMIGKGLQNLAEKVNKIDWDQVAKTATVLGKILGVVAKVIVIIIKLIGAIALAALWFASLSGVINDWVKNTAEKFAEWYTNVKNKFEQWKTDTLAQIGEWGTNAWNTFIGFFEKIGQSISDWISSVKKKFDDFVQGVKAIINKILEPFQGLFAAIKQLFMSIQNLFDVLATALGIILAQIGQFFLDKWNEILAFVMPIINSIRDFVVGVFTGLRDSLLVIWDSIKTGAKAAWDWLVTNVFTPIWKWINDYIITPFNSLKDKVVGKLVELVEAGKKRFDEFKTAIETVITNMKSGIKTKFDDAMKPITDKIDAAKKWGKDMIQGFIDGMTEKVKALTDKINWIASEIQKRLGFSVPEIGPLSKADTWMPDFVDLMATSLNKNAPQLISMVTAMAGQIHSALSPGMLLAGAGNPALNFTPTADTSRFARDIQSELAVPISAAMPQQNVVQVHKHFEYKPGVSIASPSEMRDFIRVTAKMSEVEDLRTNSSNKST